MTCHRVAAVVILLFGAATLSASQGGEEASLISILATHARVRVRTTTMSFPSRGLVVKEGESVLTVVGVVESVEAAELTLATADRDQVKIPLASISSADVSVRKKRSWLMGLVIGVGTGLVAGLAMPVDARDCGPRSDNLCSRGEAIGANILVFGSAFTAIGASVKTDVWDRRFTRVAPARDSGPAVSPQIQPR